jgi:hypothetical protein
VFQLAESRHGRHGGHTAGRSDHECKQKIVDQRSLFGAGGLPFVILVLASCVSLVIRHRSSQRYSRDLTCATKRELYYRVLGSVWRALWGAACAYAFSLPVLGELRFGMWERGV